MGFLYEITNIYTDVNDTTLMIMINADSTEDAVKKIFRD